MKIFEIDRKVKVLCVIYFMVAQSSMMARATSDSFLLKYFESGSIPLMIMAAASLSIVLALFTTYLCGRFQAFGAMKIATIGIVVTLAFMVCAVYFFGAKGENKPIYIFAYMLCETIVILPMVLFWGMAVGVLNPTESKKWMGFIGAAGTVGCIVAGFTISIVSKQEFVNELSLGMVALVLFVVIIILFLRSDLFRLSDDDQKPSAGDSNSIIRKLGVLISSKQSILMTWLVVFSAIVLSLIDINFKFEVRKDYADDLYDFFGQFYTYTSCAQLILQLFIVRAILTKGGVWAAISILPLLLLITSLAALLFKQQDAVYVGKFITQVVFFTVEYVGLQMLFLSVKKKLRGQMNSAVDGLTRPATIAVISLLITYTLPFWQGSSESDSVWRLNSIIIILCILWLFVALLNYRQYLSSLLLMVGAKAEKWVLSSNEKKLELSNEPDSIFSQLKDLNYTDSGSKYISLLNQALEIEANYKVSRYEKFIYEIRDSSRRFDISGKYFSTLIKNQINPENISFVKKEIQEIFQELQKINILLGHVPDTEQFKPLSKSIKDFLLLRLQNLCDGLQVIYQEIDFSKLISLIRAEQANLKAEAIEVLKGAYGSQKTDQLLDIILFKSPSGNEESNLKKLFESLQKFHSLKVLESAISCFDSDLYGKCKSFILSLLNNDEVYLHDQALKVLIEFEKNHDEIEKYRSLIGQKE